MSEIAYLRQVEKKIEECFIECSPDRMRPELFSVYLLLSHVVSMLTGDIRYHKESNEVSSHIFKSVVENVDELARIIKLGDEVKSEFESSYNNTIKIYLTGLNKINELIKDQR